MVFIPQNKKAKTLTITYKPIDYPTQLDMYYKKLITN